MTYGLSPRLFVEDGPAIQAARAAAARRSAHSFLAWKALDSDRRMVLVEKALRSTANENSLDGFPLAL